MLRDFDSGKVRERVEMAKSVDVLFIDDFGDPMAERSATDYARSVVYEIIDHRYGWHLPISPRPTCRLRRWRRSFTTAPCGA